MEQSTLPLLALATVVLLALAAAPCVAVAASEDRHGEAARTDLDLVVTGIDTIDGASPDPTPLVRPADSRSQYAGPGDAEARLPSLQSAPATPTRGQLYGVVVVVLLAAIGVAAWARPDVVGRASRPRRWFPGDAVGEDSDPDPADDRTLLTDEERITLLLEENGGRLRQQDVVETTDWSKAKVSRLLSSMEDDDAIVRIQIGREKLVFLSGHEPKGARSTLRKDS